MREVCHGIEPVQQPKPNINPGGDCFACAMSAVLGWCAPEKGRPTLEKVHEYYTTENSSGEPALLNIWPHTRKALVKACYEDGYPIEWRSWILQPRFDPEQWAHNWFHFEPEGDYTQHVEAFLAAGWVGIGSIRYGGGGPFTEECGLRAGDHDVLIDGARVGWVPTNGPVKAETLRHELHVVCSVKGGYWMRTMDLLRQYGLAALWLIRRDQNR